MIFHGSEIWEMLHCIFINSLQDGYNDDIWYCCFWLLKILKGSTIIGHFIQRFVNFMINMSVFGSKILKMLYCTFVKFLPDGYDKLWYFIMLFWLGRNSDWVTLNGSVLWRKVCKSSMNTSFLSKIWVMLHCTSLNLNRRIILQWTWVDWSSNWVAPKGMFYTKKCNFWPVSWKWYRTLRNASSNSYAIYRMVPFPVTLWDIWRSLQVAGTVNVFTVQGQYLHKKLSCRDNRDCKFSSKNMICNYIYLMCILFIYWCIL